jgi:hypothetical protein
VRTAHDDHQKLRRLADAWARKWDGRWRYKLGDGGFEREQGGRVLVFEVEPTKVLAFGKGTFSQTHHRFSSSRVTDAERAR